MRQRPYGPERLLLDHFQRYPDAWRGAVIAWLYHDLSDLADHCAIWYGTLPSPTFYRQEQR